MKVNGQRTPTDTPCVGICSTTALGDQICKGCGRTAYEVLRWNTFSDTEKVEINKRLNNALASSK